MRRIASTLLALAACAAAGCADAPGRIIIPGAGAVRTQAYLDLNRDGAPQTSDLVAPGVRFSLYQGDRQAFSGTTDANGASIAGGLQAGTYRFVVDSASVGDTLQVTRVDSATVTVSAGDTATLLIAVSYPLLTTAQARQATPGRKLFVEGVALAAPNALGDTAMYVTDASGSLRAVRVSAPSGAPPIVAGDSVRLVGIRSDKDGQPVLSDVIAFRLQPGNPPVGDTITTRVAATAGSGTLDASLVHIQAATMLDFRNASGGDLIGTVDDGSGPVEVNFGKGTIQNSGLLTGELVDATGILVPKTGTAGAWQLHVRSGDDWSPYIPTFTIAQARGQQPGRAVGVEGIALNSSATFPDNTLHLSDATGSIRAVKIPATRVFAGDSIRIEGTILIQNGEPVLSTNPQGITVIHQGAVQSPSPQDVSTADAASAAGGHLDAALVRVKNAVIADTTSNRTTGQIVLGVDDGSGHLEILIEPTTGAWTPGLVPGATIDATGLLVPIPPQAGGYWQLKPRSRDDVVLH